MPGNRGQRVCYCPECSLYPNGYRSIAHTTWSKHNPIPNRPYARTAPVVRAHRDRNVLLPRAASQSNVPATPPPATPPASSTPGSESYPDDIGDLDQDFDNYIGDGFTDSGDDADYMQLGDQFEQAELNGVGDNGDDPYDSDDDWGGEDGEEQPDEEEVDAFRHHDLDPVERHIYTTIAMAKATGMSKVATDTLLEQMVTALEMERGEVWEDKTYNTRTALIRLGVHPDQFLHRYIVCPNIECWELTPYQNLANLQSDRCQATVHGEPCDTPLYHTINHIRTPYKIIPYCNLSTQLRAMLRDPVVAYNINAWRRRENDVIDFGPRGRIVRDRFADTMPVTTPKDGYVDGSAWRSAVGGDVERVVLPSGSVVDETHGPHTYRHTALPFGLQLIINCDWFAVKGLKDSSVGVIYAAIGNLPRDMCFKRRYTALLTVIPGPREPAEECFNKVLAPIVADLKRCEIGWDMMLSENGGPAQLHRVSSRVLLNTSDLPATRKLSGFVGLANKAHPCHHCAITREDVNTARGYQWRDLPMRDPQKLLDAAYRHRDTNDPRERARIEERYGVRWSPMLELIGYQHSASNPVDPLHNSFLGMAKSLVNMLLANESLFVGAVGEEERIDRFTATYERANVPGHLGRIARRITRQFTANRKKAGSGLKADQWKRVVQMLPIALYVAWREEESDDISFEPVEQDPDDEPAPPVDDQALGRRGRRKAPAKAPAKEPSTDRRKWYSTILSFCSGIRILHAHSITQQDADDGVQYLSNAAQSIIQLDGHLTPNWHIAMHYSQFVRLYGPLHGYGTWPFERNNGVLSRINHNLKPHDVPSTVLRSWGLEWMLAYVLANPHPEASEFEIQALQGMQENKQAIRGTLMLDEARGNKANRTIRLPDRYQPRRMVDLRVHGAYQPLLTYLTANHPECNLVDISRLADPRPSLPDGGQCYSLYTHAIFNGFKFCSMLYSRGRKDQFALVALGENGERELCRIHLILGVDLRLAHGRLRTDLAFVEQFVPATAGVYPWELNAIDLGIRIYKNQRLRMRFVPLQALAASTIVSRLQTYTDGECLVSMSCDTDGQEPEFWLDADDDDHLDEALDQHDGAEDNDE